MRIELKSAIVAVLATGFSLTLVMAQGPPAPAAGAGKGAPRAPRVVPPARIMDFKAEPASVQGGQTVTLSWLTENPNGVTIDQGVGRVTPRGSKQVTPA